MAADAGAVQQLAGLLDQGESFRSRSPVKFEYFFWFSERPPGSDLGLAFGFFGSGVCVGSSASNNVVTLLSLATGLDSCSGRAAEEDI